MSVERPEPIDYASPRPHEPRVSRAFDRKVAVTLIICGTVLMTAPWFLAIVAVGRGGSFPASFFDVPFVWFSFLAGVIIILVAMIKAPRAGESR